MPVLTSQPPGKQRAPVPILARLAGGLLLALLGACANAPEQVARQAAELGLQGERLPGSDYLHQVYRAPGRGPRLHVYLEGDGRPWIGRHHVASDPTSPRPLALRLLGLDPAPRLYLGRPCYLGLAQTPPCQPRDWTLARYSEAVVASLAALLQREQAAQPDRELVLIGHSGGGALAMLLAPRVPGVVAVVTLAGNLDTAAWTRHHGYLPLLGSLNPAEQPALPGHILQWHLFGAEDRNLPMWLASPTLAAAALRRELPGVGHRAGWAARWPGLLRELAEALDAPSAPTGRTR